MFKTELHVHSSAVSNCASVDEETVVRRYIAAGYTSLVVTNHLSRFTYKNKRFDHSEDSWEEKIDYYMNGYNRMVAAAVGRINILLGVELRSSKDNNDYLIHGVDEAFLRSFPEIMDTPVKDVVTRVHEAGGLFFQAHPFRDSMKVIDPAILDGIEVYNGHIDHDSRNDIANMWADKYGLMKISGTDYHHDHHVIGAGISTDVPVTSEKQLVEILRSGQYRLIRGGAVPY